LPEAEGGCLYSFGPSVLASMGLAATTPVSVGADSDTALHAEDFLSIIP
jgi:hypothetical protein